MAPVPVSETKTWLINTASSMNKSRILIEEAILKLETAKNCDLSNDDWFTLDRLIEYIREVVKENKL